MSSPSESSAPADDIVVERHVTESNSGAGGGGGAGAGAGAGAGSGSAESKTAGKMSAPAGKDDTPFQVVHDQEAILNFIFSGDRGGFIGVNEKPKDRPPSPKEADSIGRCKAIEREAVVLAKSDVDAALAKLNEVIAMNESYCSAFNNRAQVYRLKKRIAEAKTDLDKAIALGRAWLEEHSEFEATRTFQFYRNVVAQAYNQKAVIARDEGDKEGQRVALEAAAEHGSAIAKAANTASNPYATLCHQTISEMLAAPMAS